MVHIMTSFDANVELLESYLTPVLGIMHDTLIIGPVHGYVRVQSYITKPRFCKNYSPMCKNFHLSHIMGILFIHAIQGIH